MTMLPSERLLLKENMKELHALVEAEHRDDLHYGALNADGTMSFCPGCEAHTALLKVAADPKDESRANAARIARVEALTTGKEYEVRVSELTGEVSAITTKP